MNTLEAIAGRRSIRKFKDAPVSDEAVEAILNAGLQAPSGKNRQPWRFVVVKEDKRDEMVRVMGEGIEQRGDATAVVRVRSAAGKRADVGTHGARGARDLSSSR